MTNAGLRSVSYPTSFAQQRLWVSDRVTGPTSAYNMFGTVSLEGALDVEALKDGFRSVVERHEVLRTSFRLEGAFPIQVVSPTVGEIFEEYDLRELDCDARRGELRRLLDQIGCTPFDLERGPLLRIALFRLAEIEYLLSVCMHHIVSDGWSVAILIREVCHFYTAKSGALQRSLSVLPIQYGDFALWQRQWMSGATLEQFVRRGKQALLGAPTFLKLPTDRPQSEVAGFDGDRILFNVDRRRAGRLVGLSRELDATSFIVLMALYQLTLWEFTGQSDFLVGAPVANRSQPETESLIGFFVNMIVVRATIDPRRTLKEYIRETRERCLEAYALQDLPFELLVEELRPPRSLTVHPLFQVIMSLQNAPASEIEFPGVHASPLDVDLKRSKFDLSLSWREENQNLSGVVRFSTAIFDSVTVRCFIHHLLGWLNRFATRPEDTIGDAVKQEASETCPGGPRCKVSATAGKQPSPGILEGPPHGRVPCFGHGDNGPDVLLESRPILDCITAGRIPAVDAAAIDYIPATQVAASGLSAEQVVRELYEGLPLVRSVIETHIGRLAQITIPRTVEALYEDRAGLVKEVLAALRIAAGIGAKVASLTGLLPSATDGGRMVDWALPAEERATLPRMTTGHGTTGASMLLSIEQVLNSVGRDLSGEILGFLGLGSIGSCVLDLMLSRLPHPKLILLCDVPGRMPHLEQLREEAKGRFGFRGEIALISSRGAAPGAFYDSTLVIGATNVPEVLDVGLLHPGCLVIDDSSPHCFDVDHAIHRLKAARDVILTEGGRLRLPLPATRLVHLSDRERRLIPERLLKSVLTQDPNVLTGCAFSALISATDSGILPTLGPLPLEEGTLNLLCLARLGITAPSPRLGDYILEGSILEAFRSKYGGTYHVGSGSATPRR